MKHRADISANKASADVSSPTSIVNATKLLQKYRDRQHEMEARIEELQNINQELEASRGKYALLYDFAPVGYFTFNHDGSIRTVNLTGAKLLGMDCAALFGQLFAHFVAEEDLNVYMDFMRTVFQCQEKMTCRVKLSTKSKQLLHVRIEALADKSGDECHAALVDITERNLAEEYLRDSEYNLAKAQSMSHVGSWRSDPLSGEIRVSDELLRIMNVSREEATPEVLASLIDPEDRENVLARLRQGAEQGGSYEIEHRLLLRDGTSKWVYSIVEPSVNIARQVVRLYGTTQDITERKQVEVRLRNKKNELQAIFDAVNDGVFVFDHNGSIQHFNHICVKFFPETVLNAGGCRDIFHPELAFSPHDCPVELALHGERVETSLVSVGDGCDTRYMDITANPIKDEFGEKTRVLVFMRDVTLKRVHEMQLIQTEKMSSIGVLATGVAHEINNPLTSVAGYAEALLRRFRDEPSLALDSRLNEFPKYLGVIVREVYNCKGIIGRLLNFGRKSDGLNYLVKLNDFLLETLELIKHQPNYGEISVVVELKENIPDIIGDPALLRQVFMNLLINACHAVKAGGRIELVSTYAEQEHAVIIQVRDNGCGIANEIIDRIWDPFFTTKDVGKGIGLGLALSYNIIKSHGGEISVKSTVGEGSQFTVRLPLTPGLKEMTDISENDGKI